ncbi:hypothetical protein CMI47_10415 [Candidatus Pacearchaeota archaeon]|nr:hypothetical protein [Candidatus Pacearchaeota archaeon]|tara:strand:- start:730 stop:1752 length:1023 start_codon:yes stop_codon:yes gene_type:complete
MAFLDNSGDIILDAVLTNLGRRRMAQGNFKITKYAFGDDEVDYSLYNKDHPSGSAYYDLEILQTPLFEAFASSDIGISYGLASYGRTDLLYLPEIKMNEITADQAVQTTSGIIYLAANAETGKAIKAAGALGNSNKFLANGSTTGYSIVLESGLDTTDLIADSQNRISYLVANNLVDSTFNVYFDTRFISNALTPTSNSRFTNDSSGNDKVSMRLKTSTGTSKASGLSNMGVTTARGIADTVYNVSAGGASGTDVSVLSGPRGAATSLNFKILTGLDNESGGTTDSKFSLYGKTAIAAATVFSGDTSGYTYDYIDTEVTVEGASSGARSQLTLRIIRRAS